MLRVTIPAALVALLLIPEPASAQVDIGVRARVGDVDIGVRAGDGIHRPGFRRLHRPLPGRHGSFRHRVEPDPRAPILFGSGPVNDFARDRKRAEVREPAPRHRPYRRFHRRVVPHVYPWPYYYDGYVYSYDDDYRDEPSESERYVAPPEPPAATPAPEPPARTVPDARGPRFETARGRSPVLPLGFEVGQPLPRGVPHVALDWEDYDLPRPPRGQSYVRFGDSVLLIDSGSRTVLRVLWPDQG